MKSKSRLLIFSLIFAVLLGVNVSKPKQVIANDFFDSTEAPVNYFEDNLPKRIISNFGEDASTQMLVTWQINKDIDDQYLLLASYADVTYSNAIKLKATITEWELLNEEFPFADQLKRNLCRVDINDLLPGVKYRYKVGNDDYLSDEYYFTTANSNGEFTFAMMSDPQSIRTINYSNMTLAAQRIMNEDKADFLLIGGDISELGGVEDFYSRFFLTQNILKEMPVSTIPGNHEALLYEEVPAGSYYHEIAGEYRAYSAHFYNPSNGPDFSLNSSYYYKYNECLFVMINTQFSKNDLRNLATWVDETITNNPSKYVIVMMHKGCFGNRYYGMMDDFNTIFTPVFDKHKVDLVMSGHDHTWARTHAVNDNKNVADVDGTVYWIVGTPGPKFYEPAPGADKQFAYSTVDTLEEGCYSYVTVGENGIFVQGLTISGSIVDEFFIPAKRDDEGNQLENYDTNLSINVETYGTTALLDLSVNSLSNVDYFILENIDGSDIEVIDKHEMSYEFKDLYLNSKYEYQIRTVYKDETNQVNRFEFITESYLSVQDNKLVVDKFMNNVAKYNIYINNDYKDTLFIDEIYSLGDLKAGNYLITIEQLYGNEVLTKDYIFLQR